MRGIPTPWSSTVSGRQPIHQFLIGLVRLIVGPSTSGVVFVLWQLKTTTPVGEVAVMTDLLALPTVANVALMGRSGLGPA
jgi:hypothetical protein